MFKTLRGRIIFSTGMALLLMLCLLVGVILWFSDAQRDLLNTMEVQFREDLIQTIKISCEEPQQLARIGVESVAGNPEVLSAFANRDRDQLIQLCLPIYKSMKDLGVTRFGFFDESLRSYLMLDNLQQAEDDLSYRASLIKARVTGQVVTGLETDEAGFVFRAIVPLMDEDGFIGVVEYGTDFGEKFAKGLQQNTGADIFLYKFAAGESLLISGTSPEDKYRVKPVNIELAVATGKTRHENIEQGVAIIYPFSDINGQGTGFIKAVHPGRIPAISNQPFYRALFLSGLAFLFGLTFIYFVVSRGLRPVDMLVDTIEQMKLRGLSHKLTGAVTVNEFGKINHAVQELAGLLNKSINVMQERNLITSRSLGKLEPEVNTAKDTVSSLVMTTKGLAGQLGQVVEKTRQASFALSEITNGAEEIAVSATNTALHSNQTNQKVLDSSNKANQVSQDIEQMIQASRAAVAIVTSMQSLSSEIGTILDVILTVAEETNLLAINAAIEAASAGEQGRGFAVVADEIRKLAENTRESTHTIGVLIDRITTSTVEVADAIHNIDRSTESSAQLVSEVILDIHDITHKVGVINAQIENIASATQQQTAASQEVSASIQEIEHFGLVAREALQGIEGKIGQLIDFVQHTENTLADTSIVSQGWSYYELRETLAQCQAEHELWVSRIRCFEPVEFDPSNCNLGQFLYNYHPHNSELIQVFDKFDEPHHKLHEAGHLVMELAQAGRQDEANEALKALGEEYQKVRAVFEEFYNVLERLFREGTLIF